MSLCSGGETRRTDTDISGAGQRGENDRVQGMINGLRSFGFMVLWCKDDEAVNTSISVGKLLDISCYIR